MMLFPARCHAPVITTTELFTFILSQGDGKLTTQAWRPAVRRIEARVQLVNVSLTKEDLALSDILAICLESHRAGNL